MTAKFRLLLFLSFIPIYNVFAQYTDMINANRPGVSQGAFSVGKNILQLETGFNYGKEKHSLRNTETDAWGIDYSIRYGLLKEQLEISFMGEYQNSNVVARRDETKLSNFKSNTFGAKYLIYDPYKSLDSKLPNLRSWKANNRFDWLDLIPAISIYVGINVDFPDNPYTEKSGSTVSPKFLLATQHNWKGGFVFVTNFMADFGATNEPTLGYILTLTHATNRYFSIFIENQGISNNYYADQILRGGFATLINPDLEVDLSVSTNFKDTPSKLYGRLGLAYRLDFHKEDEYILDVYKSGKDVTKDKEKKEKRAKAEEQKKEEKRARKERRKNKS